MKILSVISRLLDYPTSELTAHSEEILTFIHSSSDLSDDAQQKLVMFVEHRLAGDVLDWQSEYDGLFERGRSLSLLIYEHIHGESRDRGQAMVNLVEQYKLAGLDIGVKELPDYLPLFLEFVSTQQENAVGWLQDIVPVMALLMARLQKRDSDYALLMDVLLQLSQAEIDLEPIKTQIADEKRDDTSKALDKVWEEEAITFGGDAVNGGCPSSVNKPQENQRRDQDVPIQFVKPQTQSAVSAE